MPILYKGQTYSVGPLGSLLAFLVLVACFVLWLGGHATTAGMVLLLIAGLALAILL